MHDPATLARVIPTLTPVVAHDPWSRIVSYDALSSAPPGSPPGSPPEPLWPGGSRKNGQRFTPKGGFDTIYIACDPNTANAETLRTLVAPDGSIITLKAPPGVLLNITGYLTQIIDLTDMSIQNQLGTSTLELTGEWRLSQKMGLVAETQVLGREIYSTGLYHGIRYISARNWRYDGVNLAVFTDTLPCIHGCHLEVYDPGGRLYQRYG
jgi:RES domain-containing protein